MILLCFFVCNGFMSIMRTNKAALVLHFPVINFTRTPIVLFWSSFFRSSTVNPYTQFLADRTDIQNDRQLAPHNPVVRLSV